MWPRPSAISSSPPPASFPRQHFTLKLSADALCALPTNISRGHFPVETFRVHFPADICPRALPVEAFRENCPRLFPRTLTVNTVRWLFPRALSGEHFPANSFHGHFPRSLLAHASRGNFLGDVSRNLCGHLGPTLYDHAPSEQSARTFREHLTTGTSRRHSAPILPARTFGALPVRTSGDHFSWAFSGEHLSWALFGDVSRKHFPRALRAHFSRMHCADSLRKQVPHTFRWALSGGHFPGDTIR